MPELTKKVARYAANGLPVYRVVRGFQTAERLRTDMFEPKDRTWCFAGRVLLDASTDLIDGICARHAGATRYGGYLDQIADKLWFLTITKQLVDNDEFASIDLYLPAARDLGALGLRLVGQHYGLNTDAKWLGKAKTHMQVAAVVSACSPLAAEYPDMVQAIYHIATGASAVSGIDMLRQYSEEILDRYQEDTVSRLVSRAVVDLAQAA